MAVSISFVILTIGSCALSMGSGGGTLASQVVTLVIGLIIPACGYTGAKRRDKCGRAHAAMLTMVGEVNSVASEPQRAQAQEAREEEDDDEN